MRKRLIVAVTFLGGVYFVIEFLLPEYFPSGLGRDGAQHGVHFREYHEEILTGLQTVGMAAIGLGLINIFRVFGVNVLKRRKGWPFSLTLILAMLAMMTVTFWLWFQDLGLQHRVGPLAVQREFQTRLLNFVGRAPPNEQAGQRLAQMRDMALQRYLADTRKSVSPPAVSTGAAAVQLAALANFLKGQGPAPAFYQVTDAPANPPEYGAAEDLLAPAKEATEPQTLKSPGAEARLAELAKQRDELTGRLLKASEALKAQTGLDVAGVAAEQATACREAVAGLHSLSAAVRGLGDAERAVYTKPADFDLRYRGGLTPPPVPMFGRLYLAARAQSHAAEVLGRYAKVLEEAAAEIPQAAANQQTLANWLAVQAKECEALRQDWRQRAAADAQQALPAVTARLAAASGQPDALRKRMLEDLENAGTLGSAYDQALAALDTRTADAPAQALAALKSQEASLRLLRVRVLEQDLSYLDLTDADSKQLVTEELRAQAGAAGEAAAKSAEVLNGVAAAAQGLAGRLNAERQQMQKDLDAAVAGLRKTWREKTSGELRRLRDEEETRKREIAALQTRAIVVAEAQKMAAAAAKAAALPEVEALGKLSLEWPGLKSTAEAEAALAKARKAVVEGELYVLQSAAKTVERFASKHDMKDLRALAGARDSIRALTGAAQSDALLHAAACDAQVSAQALQAPDLAAARQAMESSLQQIAQAQAGMREALQEDANRSVVRGLYTCVFDGLYVSLGAAMFSLLAFYIASAAYRAFRVKSAEAGLMMTAALLVMLGQIPFGSYISSQFPVIRLWVLQVFSTPAFRGIALGAAVAFLAMAMRMWLSLETSAFYREEEEGA